MSSGPAVAPNQLARFARITLKELREILRDRRTILTLLLMPLLVYPLLSVAFQQFLLASTKPEGRPTFRIAFFNQEDAGLFGLCLVNGRELTPPRPLPPEAAAARVREFGGGVRLQTILDDDPMGLLHKGQVDLVVRIPNPEAWHETLRVRQRPDGQPGIEFDPERDVRLECEVSYVHGSWYGEQALDYVDRLVMASNARFVHRRLADSGAAQPGRADPVRLSLKPQTPEVASASFSLKAFVPLILILMTITGAVYPAIDLTAGERERGTLEVLVAAPVPRLGLLFAKYLAVVVVAMLTAITNLGMMTLTLSFRGVGLQVFDDALTVGAVFQVLLLLLLFAAFFSALLLVLTSFARSFKEAQAYVVPLVLLTLAPGMISMLPGIQLEGLLTVAPLVNMVLLTRDLFASKAEVLPAVIVVLSTLLYAAAALALAARIFGAEAVLYSEQSGWSDLFRRPSEPQPAASVVTALVCLALMFPLTYLLTGLAAGSGTFGLRPLAWVVLLSVGVFAGVPGVAAWMGRVRVGSGFRLQRPPVAALLGAVLLGVGVWVFAHEGLQLLRAFGLLRSHLATSEEWTQALLARWRVLPPAAVVLAFGVVIPVVEELFFRGYLFAALRQVSGAVTTVVVSAILFGLFHLVTTALLAPERFLGSTLMGLILGWLCWRTGSVVPGMVLHACNNSVLVLVALYPGRLAEFGWEVEQGHAPVLWLVVALVSVAAGVVLASAGRPATIRGTAAAIQ